MKLLLLKNSKLIKQVSVLIISNILLVIFGFGIKKIQTQSLGSIDYGEYAFFISFITFVSLFFRFGFFVSLQNLLAKNHNIKREKKILAVGFTIAIINGIALAISVWLFSFIINDLFNTNIGSSLQLFAPLTIIYPFFYLFNSYGTGINNLNINALYSILPKFLFFIFLILFFNTLSLNLILFLNLTSSALIIIYLYFKTKPDFSNFQFYWNLLILKNKKYGFDYYKGAIANQTTYKLDELFISFFNNTKLLGFYSLALLIASPMLLMSQALNQSMFKRYSNIKKIPSKIITFNTLWLILCVVFLFFFSTFIVHFLFGEEFKVVSKYVIYISFVLFFHGMSTPYSFLAAKSKGKEIRNVAWSEAIINISGNIILIPIYGIEGAITTSLLAKITNYFYFRYYYKMYLKQLS